MSGNERRRAPLTFVMINLEKNMRTGEKARLFCFGEACQYALLRNTIV